MIGIEVVSRKRITNLFLNKGRIVINAFVSIKARLLGANGVDRPYECESCNTRLARQPFNCPECGCYQVNWIGWQDELEWTE
jgi:rubrerythrin